MPAFQYMDDVGCCVCDVIYIQMKCVRLVNNHSMQTIYYVLITSTIHILWAHSLIVAKPTTTTTTIFYWSRPWALGFEPTNNRQTNKTIKSIIRKLFKKEKKKKVSNAFREMANDQRSTTQPSSKFEVWIIRNLKRNKPNEMFRRNWIDDQNIIRGLYIQINL